MTEPTHEHVCIARCHLFETKKNCIRLLDERHHIPVARQLQLSVDFSPGFLEKLALSELPAFTSEVSDAQRALVCCGSSFDRAVMLMLLAELSL